MSALSLGPTKPFRDADSSAFNRNRLLWYSPSVFLIISSSSMSTNIFAISSSLKAPGGCFMQTLSALIPCLNIFYYVSPCLVCTDVGAVQVKLASLEQIWEREALTIRYFAERYDSKLAEKSFLVLRQILFSFDIITKIVI